MVARTYGLIIALLVTSMMCQGCPHHEPVVKHPTPTVDAAIGNYPATCDGVCSLGAALGCPFAESTHAGASCSDVCNNVQSSGVTAWDLGCRARKTSCAAIAGCQ